MRTAERDYYKVLQVDPEANPEVIQAAYETLASKLHPLNDLTGVHEIRLKELNRAYDVLSSPGRRRAYDIERSAEYRPMGPGERIGMPAGQPPTSVLREGQAEPAILPQAEHAGAHGLTARLNAGLDAQAGDHSAPVGSTVLDFGRFAGRTLRDIASEDTEYLRWLTRHSSGIRYRNEIERLLRAIGEPV